MNRFLIFFIFCLVAVGVLDAEIFENSRLENSSPPILHLKGDPYQLGYSHGHLLKEAISSNVKNLVDDQILKNQQHPQIKAFLGALPNLIKYIPEEYIKEIEGLADGSQINVDKLLLLNLIPEMFHCLGMTVANEATENGELFHVRVLDYNFGQGLQNSAVLMVVEPEGKIPFVNISYAGFIGSVTGMNKNQIAIGEIGGKGYGSYNGIPMAFLLRLILEKASGLEEIKEILNSSPRTCEYFYVFSDGKTKKSFGVYATEKQLQSIDPGTSYAIFDPTDWISESPQDKFIFLSDRIEVSNYLTVIYKDVQKQILKGLIHKQPQDCLIITGFSRPERYSNLLERLVKNYGRINANDLMQMIKAPVSLESNLHNAIFAPSSLDFWISHAGSGNEPAYNQPYSHYNLKNLLR